MAGYSKLRLISKKSRSIDFSDLLVNSSSTFPSVPSDQINTIHEHELELDQNQAEDAARKSADVGGGGSVGGMSYLSKNSSVSTANSSRRFGLERQRSLTSSITTTTPRSGIRSAVKRAFSMRRSSSSSVTQEKYCRIHDQCVAILLETPFDDDNDDETETKQDDGDGDVRGTKTERSMEKQGSRGKIFNACKRLLGIH